MRENLIAVVLAAGKGTRLHSDEHPAPKCMRLAAGRPLLGWVLDALDFVPRDRTVLVGGYKKEQVFGGFPDCLQAVQEPQLGTGHAVLCAEDCLKDFCGTVLVCYGDMPLLRKQTYLDLLARHAETGAACTLLSGTTEEALPYGRVLRDEAGDFLRVVEDRDCSTPELRAIRELNVGIYAFDCQKLLPCLHALRADNAQKEYYLTDVPDLLRQKGERVAVHCAELGEELLGVNTPEQLAAAEACLLARRV